MSNSVRRWLGVEILSAGQLAIESRVSRIDTNSVTLPLFGQQVINDGMRHEEVLVLLAAIDKAQDKRHEELLGAINRLSTILTNAHLTEPPMFHAPVLDWEQVQADALAQLEREMEK
jgi:hypothetical protein